MERKSEWRAIDVKMAVVVSMFHLLCVFAPFTFSWSAFWVAVGLLWLTGLFGITISFHRNLSHRSFDLPKWLEYFFAYCGVLSGQRDPIFWVSIHRYHHQFADTERDPHSPKEGFWFSHMAWLFDSAHTYQKHKNCMNVEDLKKQPFYNFLKRSYNVHLLALTVLLYALGGFSFVVWGMPVIYGESKYGRPMIHPGITVLTFGEGWHNNHHAFENSARQGLEWWQYDPTWSFICFLKALGLATNVKLPTKAQKQMKSLSSSSLMN